MNIKVFTQFKDYANSYPLGEQSIGILKPGRYSGFSYITGTTLNIRLKHSNTIKKSSPVVSGTITEKVFGSLFMPNGCTIHVEDTSVDEGIPLTIENNIGNTSSRFDLIVAEHEYVNNQGGQPPVIFIQKGPAGGVKPVLANPKKQIIIGTIEIIPNGSSFSSLVYTRSPVPTLGEETFNEMIARMGLTPLFAAKADNTALAATNVRVKALEDDTTVADLAEDINYIETVTIVALAARVKTLEDKPDNTLKTHVTYLGAWIKDRKYTISHEIPTYTTILTCNVELLCTAADVGYSAGDVTQAQGRGYDEDGSKDYDYGISVQYKPSGSTQCTIMIGDRVHVGSGPTISESNNNAIQVDPAKWAIRLVWIYR